MHNNYLPELSAEAIQSPPLPLQGIDHIHGSDSLPLGMFSVGDRIPDHVLEEHLQNTPSLLIDQPGDALDATSPCQSTNGRLSDALNVVPQHLPVPLGTSLAQTFASLATASHVVV